AARAVGPGVGGRGGRRRAAVLAGGAPALGARPAPADGDELPPLLVALPGEHGGGQVLAVGRPAGVRDDVLLLVDDARVLAVDVDDPEAFLRHLLAVDDLPPVGREPGHAVVAALLGQLATLLAVGPHDDDPIPPA